MITETTLYWITRLDNINAFLVLLTFLFTIAAAVFLVNWILPENTGDERRLGRFGFLLVIPFIFILSLGLVFLPTTKEMCAIKVIPALANNEKIQGIGDKVLTFANEWMDGLLKKTEQK